MSSRDRWLILAPPNRELVARGMDTYFDTLNVNLPGDVTLETFFGKSRPTLLREIEALRVRVWKESGFAIAPERQLDTHWGDEWDDLSTHFVAIKADRPIAARRVSLHNHISETPYPDWFNGIDFTHLTPITYISRLVVAPEYQRQGFSDYFDKKCVEYARMHGAGVIIGDVPDYRIKPLLRRGFVLTSKPKLGILFPTMQFTGVMLKLRD